MDGDAYRNMSHKEMQQALVNLFAQCYDEIAIEAKLNNGKIADILINAGGDRVIIEIKSELKASLLDAAYEKYAGQCDRLYVATPPALFYEDVVPQIITWHDPHRSKIGLIVVEWQRIALTREAEALR